MRQDVKSLKQITSPIFEDIKLFQKEFEDALHSEVRLINTIAKYILRHKGKHIRPILTILAARVCGQPTLNSYRAAAMIELLHIATLIHDDVVDEAKSRRGWPSINRVWKNKVSVLMGDFILSKALINMIGLKDFEALELISKTAEQLSAGEILQIEKSITKSMTEDTYYRVIFQKTASLVSTSCELGAITSSRQEKDREAMRTYGARLGMAFQIKDDMFDLLGSEAETGKDMASDVRKNMLTLPLIHSFSTLTKAETRQINAILRKRKKSSRVLQELRDIIDSAGGFEYARHKIDEYSNQAMEAIAPYPDSPYKQSMIDLIAFNAQRTK
ncbi:MAG: polyprenyl synthetase family protein [FCB group bacterium]|nr:polyprenyl synthetase family protein [FCB group bacterium]